MAIHCRCRVTRWRDAAFGNAPRRRHFTTHLRLALLLIGSFGIYAAAVADNATNVCVTPTAAVTTSVSIRESAATSSALVGKLVPGNTMPLLDDVPNWYHVQTSDQSTGYVSKRWTETAIPVIILLIVGLAFSRSIDHFLSPSSLADTARQAGEIGFIGLGMALVVIAGGIDLCGIRARDIAYLPQVADIDRTFPISVYDMVAMGLWRSKGPFGGIDRKDHLAIEAGLAAIQKNMARQVAKGAIDAGEQKIDPGVGLGAMRGLIKVEQQRA